MGRILLTALMFVATCASAQLAQHGKSYLGRPYVAHTLESNGEEQLIIRRNQVDCTTYVEYVMAEVLSNQKNESFADILQKIRYLNGKIDGYASRLHYASDWADNSIRHGFLEDVTAAHSPYTQTLSLSYMSSHPQLYAALKNSPEDLRKIKEREKTFTGKQIHWIPKSHLPAEGLPYIKEGDILLITTSIAGLDIAHMGIATYVDNHLHLLHASSSKGQVVISDTPLSEMLKGNKSWTGIRVLRVILPATATAP